MIPDDHCLIIENFNAIYLQSQRDTKMLYCKNTVSFKDEDVVDPLENDFRVYKDSKHIPITTFPSYARFGMVGLCLTGSVKISIHNDEYLLNENQLIVILPGQLVSAKEISSDFSIDYFTMSHSLFNDVLSGICRFSASFFLYMRSKSHYKLIGKEVDNFTNYYRWIYSKSNSQHLFRREYIINLLRLLYLDLYNNYKNTVSSKSSGLDARKEELAYNFFLLILEYYKENRDVAFYADKLCITPKYLSTVVKTISGKSAKEWILEYIILEIKDLLKCSTLNIQEIATKTHFANQSSLGRFFRKHTGMSLSQYRMNK